MARKSKKSKPRSDDERPPADSHSEYTTPKAQEEGASEPLAADEAPSSSEDLSTREEASDAPDAEEYSEPQDEPAGFTVKEETEPEPEIAQAVMPPYDMKTPANKKHRGRAGTFLFILVILGLGALLFYQNRETTRTARKLQDQLAKMEAQIEAIETSKMDEKSGVLIAQTIKTLKEEMRALKEGTASMAMSPQEAPVLKAAEAPGEEPETAEEMPETEIAEAPTETLPGEVPDSEIAVDPRILATGSAVEEEAEAPGEEPETVEETPEAEVAAIAEPLPSEDDEAESELDQEANDEDEKAPASTEPVGEVEGEAAKTRATVPEEAAHAEDEPAVERTPVVQDYLSFIEDTFRKFAGLLEKSFGKIRDAFSG